MPAWKSRAISLQDDTMKLMSGSLVLRSGVGTQMLMVSSSRTAEKSVVARNFPELHQRRQDRTGNVSDVGIARVDAATFSSLTSMPVTVKPALANSTASGSPTYPRPTMPTRARLERIFSARISALATGTVSSVDSVIEPVFSHRSVRFHGYSSTRSTRYTVALNCSAVNGFCKYATGVVQYAVAAS